MDFIRVVLRRVEQIEGVVLDLGGGPAVVLRGALDGGDGLGARQTAISVECSLDYDDMELEGLVVLVRVGLQHDGSPAMSDGFVDMGFETLADGFRRYQRA
jgi:hypothetical protein